MVTTVLQTVKFKDTGAESMQQTHVYDHALSGRAHTLPQTVGVLT